MSLLSERLLRREMSLSKARCAAILKQKGDVTISAQGKMEGNLHAKEAILRGHLEGSIRADKVVLCASCNVKGDIVHGRIVIEDGAQFEGNCRPSPGPTQ